MKNNKINNFLIKIKNRTNDNSIINNTFDCTEFNSLIFIAFIKIDIPSVIILNKENKIISNISFDINNIFSIFKVNSLKFQIINNSLKILIILNNYYILIYDVYSKEIEKFFNINLNNNNIKLLQANYIDDILLIFLENGFFYKIKDKNYFLNTLIFNKDNLYRINELIDVDVKNNKIFKNENLINRKKVNNSETIKFINFKENILFTGDRRGEIIIFDFVKNKEILKKKVSNFSIINIEYLKEIILICSSDDNLYILKHEDYNNSKILKIEFFNSWPLKTFLNITETNYQLYCLSMENLFYQINIGKEILESEKINEKEIVSVKDIKTIFLKDYVYEFEEFSNLNNFFMINNLLIINDIKGNIGIFNN